ncbi:YqiA/YcfP family alpha/beta fold hydrolase [Thalassotalea sp. 1_MG-2023]|uniref:YqiA/YcfP family alpha/beta fold hydrolase n=1 Tax=Thalassotalea sp. 1_MG-2023 TaxID=3062680 RepID=UPI0026E35488|nr:YqiA/YcfP family alpha/beta fold hydrolase [Thalassotalea sp. 1_MG-2023]MDO6427543.1 YqiA/YcfP family alpha/beta fold hydrolase [Thalassotalea sp. 1_MG-2023]
MKIIFSHGKESGPWGSKITTLAKIGKAAGFQIDSLDYRHIANPDDRVIMLNDYLAKEMQPYVLVGSSMGGYVSLVAAQTNKPLGLFLLAPALYMPNYAQQMYDSSGNNIEIIHGWSDDVIPVEHSIRFGHQTQCALHLIDGDHRLNSAMEQVSTLFESFIFYIKTQFKNRINT